MNKILVFMLSFSGLCQYIIAGPIVVRGAGHRDLKQIEVLDRRPLSFLSRFMKNTIYIYR